MIYGVNCSTEGTAEARFKTSAKEYQIGRYADWLSIPDLFISREKVTGSEFVTGKYPTRAFTPLRVPVLPRSFPAADVALKVSRIVPVSSTVTHRIARRPKYSLIMVDQPIASSHIQSQSWKDYLSSFFASHGGN